MVEDPGSVPIGGEEPISTKEKSRNSEDLLDKYIIDVAKSQEDAAKQLLSIDVVLMGIYLTFISNAQNLEVIKSFILKHVVLNSIDYRSSLIFFIHYP
jgi:hypothetical protein